MPAPAGHPVSMLSCSLILPYSFSLVRHLHADTSGMCATCSPSHLEMRHRVRYLVMDFSHGCRAGKGCESWPVGDLM